MGSVFKIKDIKERKVKGNKERNKANISKRGFEPNHVKRASSLCQDSSSTFVRGVIVLSMCTAKSGTFVTSHVGGGKGTKSAHYAGMFLKVLKYAPHSTLTAV
jgi:hypothetical protein